MCFGSTADYGRRARRICRPASQGKSNRKTRIRHANKAYKKRNAVERRLERLADFRRIATRDRKVAQNLFLALCFAATLAC